MGRSGLSFDGLSRAAQAPVVKTKATMAPTAKVYILFYSTYGHVYKLALAEKEGVDSVEGVEGVLLQVKGHGRTGLLSIYEKVLLDTNQSVQ
jgi:hypothetical protein